MRSPSDRAARRTGHRAAGARTPRSTRRCRCNRRDSTAGGQAPPALRLLVREVALIGQEPDDQVAAAGIARRGWRGVVLAGGLGHRGRWPPRRRSDPGRTCRNNAARRLHAECPVAQVDLVEGTPARGSSLIPLLDFPRDVRLRSFRPSDRSCRLMSSGKRLPASCMGDGRKPRGPRRPGGWP
jgi:hypothetical protein